MPSAMPTTTPKVEPDAPQDPSPTPAAPARNRLERWLEKGSHVRQHRGGLDILRYIGPSLLVTVGFIDPGNWASNMAAGSTFGYALLWMVTLSTIMLIVLQHNAAHLGIVTGKCLAEATTSYLPRWLSRIALTTGLFAVVATALAEILGGAIALNMLLGLPIKIGAVLAAALALTLLLTGSYKRIERVIIGFVSLIGVSFLIEVALVNVDWPQAAVSWVSPSLPSDSLPIVMSVLGAVVMPHNLFLHSEVIQSNPIDRSDDAAVSKRLRLEFVDTLVAMGIGWAINSSMILLAAATLFSRGIVINDLSQAAVTLEPVLGPAATFIFALALLLAGISSAVTVSMTGGIITAGICGEPFDLKDRHSRFGVIGCVLVALGWDEFTASPCHFWQKGQVRVHYPQDKAPVRGVAPHETSSTSQRRPPRHSPASPPRDRCGGPGSLRSCLDAVPERRHRRRGGAGRARDAAGEQPRYRRRALRDPAARRRLGRSVQRRRRRA